MGELVSFQVTRLRKGCTTLHTSIRLHPAMNPFVYCENIESFEFLATLLAGEVHAGRWLEADWGVRREALCMQRIVDTKHCWSTKVRVMYMFG